MNKKIYFSVCIFVTFLLLLWIVFPARWSAVRLWESVVDLCVSIAFYFLTVSGFDGLFEPTVNRAPAVPYAPLIPLDPDDLRWILRFSWRQLFVKDNCLAYLSHVNTVLLRVSRLGFPLILAFVWLFIYLDGLADETVECGGESSALLKWKAFFARFKKPVVFVRGFFGYVASSFFFPFWVSIVICGSNLLTQGIGAVSFYLYFVSDLSVKSFYFQLYKWSLDISVAFAALPLIFWVIFLWILFDKLRSWRGIEKLRSFESRNDAFLESLPLVVLITGTMGSNKTKMMTDFSLSMQDNFRRRQLRTLMTIEAEFPFFSWNEYGRLLKSSKSSGEIRSLSSAKIWGRKFVSKFLTSLDPDYLFGYDLLKYGIDYDNGIVTVSLFDDLIEYAQLYYMYSVGCLVASNYSIRMADVCSDVGNLPLWENDYFDSPSVRYNDISRYSHVLDFDTLRLGKTMKPESPDQGAFEFGVVSHTEMGKDFGNSLTNADYKKSDDTANPKNDMMTARLKMSRHSSTVRFYPYFRYFGDEQRPTSVGADAREVMNVIRAKSASEDFYSVHLFLFETFWVDLLKAVWQGWYVRYRHNRNDETVPSWLLKIAVQRIVGGFARKFDRFVYNVVDLSVEAGSLEEEQIPGQYFLCHKKIHARRYSTDCFAEVFAKRSQDSTWSFDASPCFAGDVATLQEVVQTNSYFGADLLNISKSLREPASNDEPSGASSATAHRRRP